MSLVRHCDKCKKMFFKNCARKAKEKKKAKEQKKGGNNDV